VAPDRVGRAKGATVTKSSTAKPPEPLREDRALDAYLKTPLPKRPPR
jgi:hypothetical protein